MCTEFIVDTTYGIFWSWFHKLQLLSYPPRPISHVNKTKANYSYLFAHAAYRGEVCPSDPVVEPWAPPPPSPPSQPHQQDLSGTHQGDKNLQIWVEAFPVYFSSRKIPVRLFVLFFRWYTIFVKKQLPHMKPVYCAYITISTDTFTCFHQIPIFSIFWPFTFNWSKYFPHNPTCNFERLKVK